MKILQGAAQAALARLDELASQNKASQESAQHLRKHYEARVRSITKRFKQVTDEPGEDHATTYQQLRGVLRNGELEANIPRLSASHVSYARGGVRAVESLHVQRSQINL